MGMTPGVLHLNEGHPAFTLLERIREKVTEEKLSFAEAARQVRNTSIFTTHTPVPAGHDYFPPALAGRFPGVPSGFVAATVGTIAVMEPSAP